MVFGVAESEPEQSKSYEKGEYLRRIAFDVQDKRIGVLG
jgi:hypothetical protein